MTMQLIRKVTSFLSEVRSGFRQQPARQQGRVWCCGERDPRGSRAI